MQKRALLALIGGLAIVASTAIFTACGSTDTCTCSEVYHPKLRLADCQKKVGGFKKGTTIHYVHSEGFEFDLTVSQDSIFKNEWSDFCVEAEEEDRTVLLTSTYPIMSVEVSFYGDIDDSDEEKNSRMPMLISHGNTKFSAALDSNGTPLEKGIENTLMMLDTITFNGTTYDSVFVIMDNAHYNGLNYNEEVPGDTAYLYFSKEKGILKLETTDGKSFTIKEGGDNE